MKFYDCTTAPSPRRVRVFLAEKGIAIPTIQIDLRSGEQFTPPLESPSAAIQIYGFRRSAHQPNEN